MTKEKTARLIPNAIQIATKGEKVKNLYLNTFGGLVLFF